MRRREILLIIIYMFAALPLFALAGKPKPVENIRVYYEAPKTVNIELFVFQNKTKNKDLDYLSLTAPELIAKQIERKKNIIISSNNIRLIPRDYNRAYDYKVFTFSNTTYISNVVSNELIIKTNLSLSYRTNEMKPKTNVIIEDALYTNLILGPNETLHYYRGMGIILSNNNDFKREPNIRENFIDYGKEDIITNALARENDIVVYGDIKSTRYTVIITAYIAETHAKTVNSYSIEIDYAEIEEALPRFCLEVVNRIDGIEKTGIVKISTEPNDALIYIDEMYMGKTSDQSLYIPSLTVGEHRITVEKPEYERIDKVFTFNKELEDIEMAFSLMPLTNFGNLVINVPGGSNTTVIFDGIKEFPSDTVKKNLNFGTYALKMIRPSYEDYFAVISIKDKEPLVISPEMKIIKEPTIWKKIFGNYERNTKIAIGATIVFGLATLGTYIYANEVYDATVVKYYNKYKNAPNSPPIDLQKYNTAYNFYIAGIVTTSIFALTAGIYYMLWVSEPNFPVHQFGVASTGDGADIVYSMRF